jgi:hypothetical protein
MSFEQIKRKWLSCTGKQKAAIIGSVLLVGSLANGGGAHTGGQAGLMPISRGGLAGPSIAATSPMPGYAATPGYGAMAGYGALPAPAGQPARAGNSDGPVPNADYEAREKIKEQSARGFDQ